MFYEPRLEDFMHRAFTLEKTNDPFLQSFAWRSLRMRALLRYGNRCQCCGATPWAGAILNVDHIKPRDKYPHLALNINNLQILCHVCNHGKGNWDETDWRRDTVSDTDALEKKRCFNLTIEGAQSLDWIKDRHWAGIDIQCPWCKGLATVRFPSAANYWEGDFECHHCIGEGYEWYDFEKAVAENVIARGLSMRAPYEGER